jgi:hypothetical protein
MTRKAKLLVDFSSYDGPSWSKGSTVEVLRMGEGILGTHYSVRASDQTTGIVYPHEINILESD